MYENVYLVAHEESWCDFKSLFSGFMVAIRFVSFWKRLTKYWSSICLSVLGVLLTAITPFQLSRSGVQYSIHKHLPPHAVYRLKGGNLQRKQTKTLWFQSLLRHNWWWVKCARTSASPLSRHRSYTHIYTQSMGVIQRKPQKCRWRPQIDFSGRGYLSPVGDRGDNQSAEAFKLGSCPWKHTTDTELRHIKNRS